MYIKKLACLQIHQLQNNYEQSYYFGHTNIFIIVMCIYVTFILSEMKCFNTRFIFHPIKILK